MRTPARLALIAALALPLFTTGCTIHAHARVYDSYQHSYHRWGRGDERSYEQWERDTHHNHMDYNQRSPQDQQAYWQWRHNHGHDHDRH